MKNHKQARKDFALFLIKHRAAKKFETAIKGRKVNYYKSQQYMHPITFISSAFDWKPNVPFWEKLDKLWKKHCNETYNEEGTAQANC
jgi:hypothetical protein